MATPPEPPPLHVRALDHIVLVVADVDRSLAWYAGTLGLAVEGREAFARGDKPFASVRIDGHTIIDLLPGQPTGGDLDHFAVVVDEDVDVLAASGRFTIAGGPADISGARGLGRGFYVRDPDGHRVELRNYPAR